MKTPMIRLSEESGWAQRGFTLIELTVVIALIGILASAGIIHLNEALKESRDARRKADLKKLQSALAYYYARNGSYPVTPLGWLCSEPGSHNPNNNGDWIPGLAPTYISRLPRDPLGGISPYATCSSGGYLRAYSYMSDGQNYKLTSECSSETGYLPTDPFFDPMRPTWSWMVCSGGPQWCLNY